MESLIETFNLNWSMLLAQIINFGIVFLILWYFALKPLIKVMTDRTKKIEQSLADARAIEENLKKAEETRVVKVMAAKKEAEQIIDQARITAEKNQALALVRTKEEVNKIVLEGKKQLAKDREEMIKEARDEISDLVILTTEKVLTGVWDKKLNKKLVEKTLEEIK